MVGSKFTFFALFYFVFDGNFPSTSSQGAYLWRGDLTEGFLRYRLGGLIQCIWKGYTCRGLFSEFYGNLVFPRNLHRALITWVKTIYYLLLVCFSLNYWFSIGWRFPWRFLLSPALIPRGKRLVRLLNFKKIHLRVNISKGNCHNRTFFIWAKEGEQNCLDVTNLIPRSSSRRGTWEQSSFEIRVTYLMISRRNIKLQIMARN